MGSDKLVVGNLLCKRVPTGGKGGVWPRGADLANGGRIVGYGAEAAHERVTHNWFGRCRTYLFRFYACHYDVCPYWPKSLGKAF